MSPPVGIDNPKSLHSSFPLDSPVSSDPVRNFVYLGSVQILVDQKKQKGDRNQEGTWEKEAGMGRIISFV